MQHSYAFDPVSLSSQCLPLDRYKEGDELSATLEEIDGVVSTRSFEMLLQWVYTNRIIFDNLSPAEAITASIEFSRLADICGIADVESLMADHIKQIILSNKSTEKSVFAIPVQNHIDHLTFEHIESCVLLPKGHSVCKTQDACISGGQRISSRGHRNFFQDIQRSPDFAVDLLKEAGVALASLEAEKQGIIFEDPFSRQRINL